MRLIDADLMKEEWEYELGVFFSKQIIDSIDKQPTVDAVKVVRCVDCINGVPIGDGLIKCALQSVVNYPGCYCWWGTGKYEDERKPQEVQE